MRKKGRSYKGILLLFLSMSAGLPADAAEDPALPSANALKKMSVEELMDIEVTSVSKRPEKLGEVASAIQIISSEDIRRAGASSLPEALRLASNLEVAQIDARQWAITARGFNNLFADKMLVLIDGRSVYTSLYAGVYWDAQDTLMEDIDRIEVISGPGATQWGANAVNGVINITTKSAKDTQGGLVTGAGGTEERAHFGFRYGDKIGRNLYYRVYGKFFERDSSVRPNGRGANDAWRSGQSGFRVDWEGAADNVVTVQGDVYTNNIGHTGLEHIGASGGNLLTRWSHAFSDTSQLKVQLYYDYTRRRNPEAFTQTVKTFDFDLQHAFSLFKSHTIVWGLGVRTIDDDLRDFSIDARSTSRVFHRWFTAFLQDEIKLKQTLNLTLGSKFEHNDYTGDELEPSIRLAWTPSKTQTFWGAVSKAARTPSRVERDLYSPTVVPGGAAGGPLVESEKAIAYELGYRVQIDPQIAVSLATFYNNYDGLRTIDPLNPPAPFPVVVSNTLEGRSWGLELSADWRVTNQWKLRAGYTKLFTEVDSQPDSRFRAYDLNTTHDPKHQFLLRSLWDLSSEWEIDVDFRYVGAIANQQVPGYAEMGIRLGWTPNPRWEFSLVGENLLQRQHAEFNTPDSRREIERSVSTKVSWRF